FIYSIKLYSILHMISVNKSSKDRIIYTICYQKNEFQFFFYIISCIFRFISFNSIVYIVCEIYYCKMYISVWKSLSILFSIIYRIFYIEIHLFLYIFRLYFYIDLYI